MIEMKEVQARRFRLLQWVNEQTRGREENHVDLKAHTAEFGWDLEEMDDHARYLVGEGLLTFTVKGYWVAITHLGVKEVERALTAPDQPTAHFLSLNLIFAGTITDSQIQQGTSHSSQTWPPPKP